MAWTQDDLNAIDIAILDAASAKRTKFGDREYESHELPALLALRATIQQAVTAESSSTSSSTRYAAHSKGL